MDFLTAVQTAITRTLDFSGRSRRSEFWWFTLFSMFAVIAAITLDQALNMPRLGVMPETGLPDTYQQSLFWTFRISNYPLETIVGLLLFIPLFSVMVRRLHDVGRSGYWALGYYGLGFISGPTLTKMMTALEAENMEIFETQSVMMIGMVNFAAAILYLMFMTRNSDKGPNRYGPSPKA